MNKQKKNRLKLADMLETRVTDKQFDMMDFTNSCGTVGCALGIAVLSGEFGYGATPGPTESGFKHGWKPVKDGVIVGWSAVGADLFGYAAMFDVFMVGDKRSRFQVAKELRNV